MRLEPITLPGFKTYIDGCVANRVVKVSMVAKPFMDTLNGRQQKEAMQYAKSRMVEINFVPDLNLNDGEKV